MLSAEKFYDYANEHFGWAEKGQDGTRASDLFSNGSSLA